MPKIAHLLDRWPFLTIYSLLHYTRALRGVKESIATIFPWWLRWKIRALRME